MTDDWRHSNERIAKVEASVSSIQTDVSWIKKILEEHIRDEGVAAQDISDIKIMIAEEKARRAMLKYIGHAASVLMGGIAGLFSSHLGGK